MVLRAIFIMQDSEVPIIYIVSVLVTAPNKWVFSYNICIYVGLQLNVYLSAGDHALRGAGPRGAGAAGGGRGVVRVGARRQPAGRQLAARHRGVRPRLRAHRRRDQPPRRRAGAA